MKEKGIILKIEHTTATVRAGEIGGCFGCMSQECKVNSRIYQAENKTGLVLNPGDFVEVENKFQTSLLQAFMVFLPPFAAFIAAFLGVQRLVPSSTDAMQAAAGTGALILSFFAVYWIRKLIPGKAAPQITRLLDSSEVSSSMTQESCTDT